MRLIPGTPGLYATECGRILREDGSEVKPGTSKGYKRVGIRENGKRSFHYVHRLVCLAYHGEPQPGHVARHKDGGRTNNRPDNLEWGTLRDNWDDAVRHGAARIGERHPRAKFTHREVLLMRLAAKHGATATEIADTLGDVQTSVRSAVNGSKFKHLPGAVKKSPGPPRERKSVQMGTFGEAVCQNLDKALCVGSS